MAGNSRRNDDLLITALAVGGTVVAAAASAGISESTARRRAADPDIQARVIEARAKLLEEAAACFVARMGKAGDTLDALLGATSEQVRLGAARSIIQQGLAMRQAAEIEARLAALEAQSGDKGEADRLRGHYRGTHAGQEGNGDA